VSVRPLVQLRKIHTLQAFDMLLTKSFAVVALGMLTTVTPAISLAVDCSTSSSPSLLVYQVRCGASASPRCFNDDMPNYCRCDGPVYTCLNGMPACLREGCHCEEKTHSGSGGSHSHEHDDELEEDNQSVIGHVLEVVAKFRCKLFAWTHGPHSADCFATVI
jgi:hypothetical protein